MPNILGPDTAYYPTYFDKTAQKDLRNVLAVGLKTAPFFTPHMPRTGQPWSIAMSNCGALGWVSDKTGYRYQPRHPETDAPWPPIPDALIGLWDNVTNYHAPPEACLINYYDKPRSKMGLHQDRDEQALEVPVVSLSLGDSAVFRMGVTNTKKRTRSMKLHSGDVFVFGGAARLNFHGVDRLMFGSSQLLKGHPAFAAGGRINVTLRRVTKP